MLSFFFKQKTAYDIRISDWSSDVCSSDLGAANRIWLSRLFHATTRCAPNVLMHIDGLTQCLFWMKSIDNSQVVQEVRKEDQIDRAFLQVLRTQGFELIGECRRSEEHTSELQSLMRISYAVFCLKNKHNN